MTFDIENLHFNTAISQMMIFTNLCLKKQKVTKETGDIFAKILSPFAPHLAEEIWETIGQIKTLAYEPFPIANKEYLIEDNVTYAVSFNGKRRFEIELPKEMGKEAVEEAVFKYETTSKYLEGKQYKKIIVVPGKIVNIVF